MNSAPILVARNCASSRSEGLAFGEHGTPFVVEMCWAIPGRFVTRVVGEPILAEVQCGDQRAMHDQVGIAGGWAR